MKRTAKMLALVLVSLLLLFGTAGAQTISELDVGGMYVGGEKLDEWDKSYDVIGNRSIFNISKVEVSTDESAYVFDIYTAFASHVGNPEANGIELGDLFISTNGWNPYGEYPYREDTASNGETWEYALVLDDHSGDTTSGLWNLYAVNNDNIIKSDNAMAGSTADYRRNQEVQYAAANQTSLGSGSWFLTNEYLRFVIIADLFDGDLKLAEGAAEYGFHWTMTCANDVIEGSFAPVPEPATMFLLGSGLAGMGIIGRRRKKD